MKQKTSKIVLVLASLFFGVFFFFNTAFATTTWSENGVVINDFSYDENNELVLDFGYDYDYVYTGYGQAEKICIYKDYYAHGISLNMYGTYNFGYTWTPNEPGFHYISGLVPLTSGCEQLEMSYKDAICVSLGNSCKVKFSKIYGDYEHNFLTKNYIEKSDVDYYGYTDVLETIINTSGFANDIWGGTYSYIDFKKASYYNGDLIPQDLPEYVENSNGFPISSVPAVVDGACGTVDGSIFNYADFSTQDWCSAGDFYFSGAEHNGNVLYSCLGTGGGTYDNCSASYYINGDCGTVSGTTQTSLGIENENLCSYNYLLDETSFSITATGWSWICNGLYGGYDSFCSANKTDVAFPDLPETEDCSSYTFPNNWICNINNTITSAFLPSAEKINELNLSINEIQQKAPFNYLNIAKNKITELTGNISQGGLSITLMGKTSFLNNTGLTDLASMLKTFFTFLLILAFLFWGVNYIKHFFK